MAIESQQTSTLLFSSGLQVTGTVSDVLVVSDEAVFVRTEGPTALAIKNRQLPAYNKERFAAGFASPIGCLINHSLDGTDTSYVLEELSAQELDALGIRADYPAQLHYESGIIVEGMVKELVRDDNGTLLLICFLNGQVRYLDEILWQQSAYTLAVGSKITSAFAGPADIDAFEPIPSVPREKMHKILYDEPTVRLQQLYGDVRRMREGSLNVKRVATIFQVVREEYQNDWLLPLELLELLERYDVDPPLRQEIRHHLHRKVAAQPSLAQLIHGGLTLLETNEEPVDG